MPGAGALITASPTLPVGHSDPRYGKIPPSFSLARMMMQNPALPPAVGDEEAISLIDLVRILWRRRWLIGGLTGLGALLGLGASLASLRYVSEGLFLTDIPIEAYKRYENAVLNGPRLVQFMRKNGLENAETSARLLKLAGDTAAFGKALQLESSFTDKDARALGGQTGQENRLFFRLRYESPEPAGSASLVLLGEFVRDAIIRVDMEETTLRQCNGERVREQSLRNAQIQNAFDIRQEEARAATLRTLAARHTEASDRNARQIVAVDKGTERFLPLTAQLAAAETLIEDMRLADTARERERQAAALRRDYYCKAQEALRSRPGGRAFLAELGKIQQAVFAGKDRRDSVVEQTWNELEGQRQDWVNTYLEFMRFAVPPDGAEMRERKPGIVTGVVLGVILGGAFGIFWALVLGWWRGDRHETEGEQGG